jgi:hypothetical protein
VGDGYDEQHTRYVTQVSNPVDPNFGHAMLPFTVRISRIRKGFLLLATNGHSLVKSPSVRLEVP